jgi:membrane peptidoglycan carboxypeptidase
MLRGPWTWKRIAAIVGIAFGLGIALLAILIGVAYAQTPIPSAVSQAAQQQDSIVYLSNGKTVVGTFGSMDRQLLSDSQIPDVLKNAVLAAEDRHFYTEGGVSPTGILRATYTDLTGGSIQGGSTITQQFVRNYYNNIGTAQTMTRKLKEIFVSMKLARQKSKTWILTQYLNTIYLGNGTYGVGAAAQMYFGVPASKLSVAQAATLAAIIQSPGFYPTSAPGARQALMARWQYVLNGMVAMGNLTPQQAAAQKFPALGDHQAIGVGPAPYDGYIRNAVLNELRNTYHYTDSVINNGGLRIVTTFDKGKMDALYRAVRENETLMKQGGKGLPWYAHVGAVLEQPGTGAIVAMYSGPGYNVAHCRKLLCQDDMALDAREQVGSSFKPYVLAEARAQGMNVQSSVLDGYSPLCVPPDTSPMAYAARPSSATAPCSSTSVGQMGFNVSNDQGDGSLGPVNTEVATAASLNTAYTDLLHRVGTQNVINLAQQFGVNTARYPDGSSLQHMAHQVGIALGQASITVEEQATMFNTLANNGEYVTPHVIKRITQGSMTTPASVTRREVLTPDVAADVDWALSYDVKPGGTATNAAMPDGREIIGKTGTTNAAQSAFFIGAIPQYTLAVGVFSNTQDGNINDQSLNLLGGLAGGGYGGDWPSMIWRTFAESEFAQLPALNFPQPVFGGVKWNLLGPLLTPRPHPHPRDTVPICIPGTPFCGRGHGHKSPFPCPPNLTLPGCPTPTPGPTGPSPAPTVPTGGPPPTAGVFVTNQATGATRRGSG